MTQANKEIIDANADEISLKDLILKIKEWWHYFVSKFIIILIAGIIGGILGLTYAGFNKPVYKAVLSFVLQNEKSGGGMGGALGLASQFGIDLGGSGANGEFSDDNLLVLMKSRSMVEKALLTQVNINNKKETLADFYIDFNHIREGWKDKPELKNLHFLPGADPSTFTLKQDSIIGVLHGSLVGSNVVVDKLDKKSSIIAVTVKSTNEVFSKYFAEVLAKVVSDFYIQTQIKKASKNVSMLQHQTDSVRSALYGNISGVASSIDVNPNPNPLLATTLRVPSQHKQVDMQVNTAILGELVKNLEGAKMSLLQETPLIQVIDKPTLPLEKEKLGKLRALVIGGTVSSLLTIIGLFLYKFFKDLMLNV